MTEKEYADYLIKLSMPFDKLFGAKLFAEFLAVEIYEAIASGYTIEFLAKTKELIKEK